MREDEKHIKHERRQQDLIIEFIQLGLCLWALLDQWGGLHSLSGMRKKSTSISYKKEFYTSIPKNGQKMQNFDRERDNTIAFVESRSVETI